MAAAFLRIRSSLGPFRRPLRILRRNLPPLNFITLHYLYFIGTSLLGAIIFWGASTPAQSVSFTDSLFLVISAMTLAGLNTVNLSALNTFQQFMLFVLIMLGSAIFVSAFVVHVRRRAFDAKFNKVAEEKEEHTKKRGFRISGPLSARPLFRKRPQSGPKHEAETKGDPRHRVKFINEGDNHPKENSGEEKGHAESNNEVSPSPSASTHTRPEPTAEYDRQGRGASLQQAISPESGSTVIERMNREDHITFSPDARSPHNHDDQGRSRSKYRFLNVTGVGAHSNASLNHRRGSIGANTIYSRRPTLADLEGTSPGGVSLARPLTHVSMTNATTTERYFPSSGFVGRNSQFHHLNEDERLRLGGAEYKAIKFLSWVVPVYFILWQLLGCLGLGAYVAYNRPQTARDNGLNPWWVGAFNAVSAFNNSGMSLLDANMVAFQTSVYMLLTSGLLILAGNTAYPIFLRLIIWTMRQLLPRNERYDDFRHTLNFVLDHPRRCYTNLFPSEHTWWLLLSVLILNGVDWAAFEILNIGNKAITQLPGGYEVLDGLFQALAVRSGGFYVVAIPTVRISLQVLYVVMMYISVYPVVITMRNSNVYEERSLGIYADDKADDGGNTTASEAGSTTEKDPSAFSKLMQRMHGGSGGTAAANAQGMGKAYFVRQQLRAQLAHDTWLIVLAVFVIMIIEGGQFEAAPATFSVFNVIFEVVSGYGCVGISVGVPDNSYSFCGSWHVLSKLVLCAVMLRGRHRGLPVAIDKAVLLPGESQWWAEEEDAVIRRERSFSRSGTV